MKKLFSILALILVFCMPAYAMAATEPNTKTIEETTSYESDTIRITIDRWCYAFNRTSLRFFVAKIRRSCIPRLPASSIPRTTRKRPARLPNATTRFWRSTVTITTTRTRTGLSSATACSIAMRLPLATSCSS